MTAGNLYSLSGSSSTPAFTSGDLATTAKFSDTSAVVTDPAGNVVVALSGTTPALRVIAESTGTMYGQSMTKGHAYTISGGPGATRTTTPGDATGFKFAGAPITFTPPAYGITSLQDAAPGDLLLADGATATTGSVYEITGGPTTAVGPKATSVTLSATPSGSAFQGTTVTLTATLTPSTAVGTVEYLNGATSLGSAPVAGGTAHLHTTTLPVGTLTLTAAFTPTTATAFDPSTSAPLSYKVTSRSARQSRPVSSR
jgi:hypothetical protein